MARRTSGWTEIDNQETQAIAVSLARGIYQANIIAGFESISGSTLRGEAQKWAGQYRISAKSLIDRLRNNGLSVTVEKRAHGARILVIKRDSK